MSMFCANCGGELQEGAAFCVGCGTQTGGDVAVQEASMPSASPPHTVAEMAAGESGASKADIEGAVPGVANMGKALPVKKLLTCAIPAVLMVLAITIAVPMLRGSNILTSKKSTISIAENNISFFADKNKNSVIVSGNNNAKFTINGKWHSSQKSLDVSKAVVLTDYNDNSGGTLWFVTTSNATLIAESVLAYQIADSGNGVVYTTDQVSVSRSPTSTVSLYLYDTSAKTATRIADKVTHYSNNNNSMDSVCISPDGKSVGYRVQDDTWTGYIKIDGKPAEKLEDKMAAVAISDGGKYVYYTEITNDNYGRIGASLHVKSERYSKMLSESSPSNIILNKDYSEIIFNTENGAFISRHSSEKVKLLSSQIDRLLLPQNLQARRYGGYSGNAYDVHSFANTLRRHRIHR